MALRGQLLHARVRTVAPALKACLARPRRLARRSRIRTRELRLDQGQLPRRLRLLRPLGRSNADYQGKPLLRNAARTLPRVQSG